MKRIILLMLIALVGFKSYSQSISQIYEEVSPSVVQILVKSETPEGDGNPYDRKVSIEMGTGVVISEDGEIITAAHVVESASEIEIVYQDQSTTSARIINFSKFGDVALLRANNQPKHIKVAKLGDSDKVKIGEDIMVIGFPLGLSYSLSKGIISGTQHQETKIGEGNGMEFFQTDAAINTGNSGGPMFNMKGEVIGIVSSILSRSGGFEGVGFATKINLAKKLLFKKDGFWIGIDGHFIDNNLAAILNVPQEGGLLISTVTPNSPAYFLGLRGGYLLAKIGDEEVLLGGDVILEIEGIKIDSIKNIEKVWSILDKKKKHDNVVFKVLRAGEVKDYSWKIL